MVQMNKEVFWKGIRLTAFLNLSEFILLFLHRAEKLDVELGIHKDLELKLKALAEEMKSKSQAEYEDTALDHALEFLDEEIGFILSHALDLAVLDAKLSGENKKAEMVFESFLTMLEACQKTSPLGATAKDA